MFDAPAGITTGEVREEPTRRRRTVGWHVLRGIHPPRDPAVPVGRLAIVIEPADTARVVAAVVLSLGRLGLGQGVQFLLKILERFRGQSAFGSSVERVELLCGHRRVVGKAAGAPAVVAEFDDLREPDLDTVGAEHAPHAP